MGGYDAVASQKDNKCLPPRPVPSRGARDVNLRRQNGCRLSARRSAIPAIGAWTADTYGGLWSPIEPFVPRERDDRRGRCLTVDPSTHRAGNVLHIVICDAICLATVIAQCYKHGRCCRANANLIRASQNWPAVCGPSGTTWRAQLTIAPRSSERPMTFARSHCS